MLGVFAGFFYRDLPLVDQAVSGRDEFQRGNQVSHPNEQNLSFGQDTKRLELLESRVEKLQSRIESMESGRSEADRTEVSEFSGNISFSSAANSLPEEPRSIEHNLVIAGIDPSLAEDIERRITDSELKKLELRDKAIRADYIRTDRYREELSAITADNISVRQEVGEEFFDRYLYASGRPNRVGITSVMAGSEAERAGIERGDQILSYGDQRLFNSRELATATTQGDRGEYVDIRVMRNGNEIVLPIPRGPLGVHLTSVSVDPDK